MTADIRPGEFIRLDDIAAELGVSVTPVREALLTLRGEGMVDLEPHRGYRVGPLDRVDVDDLFWLQGEIAVRLALRTAAAVTSDDLDELQWWTRRLRTAVESGDENGVIEAEFEFHRAHNVIAGGTKLAWFLLAATRYTPARLYANDPEWGHTAVDSHERLIDAYRSSDVDEAVVQTRRQFTDGAARLTRHLEQSGIWGATDSDRTQV
ncbi:putative GntR family transcriptional regulator [Gordonia sputi NBRC 100414]|uniref:Putative GntR family transcriptional regulator n=2 Tax=Gordoniaceae TaxID=85026 RepID=H5U1K5_9ACTN|nr:GntR family transcriptional regulator [Gordonia sp. 852002-51296_SCH5728562-b]GAB39613.1 putative GntR family transcriptional regulator [Gordonia sputi NBRC 100414]